MVIIIISFQICFLVYWLHREINWYSSNIYVDEIMQLLLLYANEILILYGVYGAVL